MGFEGKVGFSRQWKVTITMPGKLASELQKGNLMDLDWNCERMK